MARNGNSVKQSRAVASQWKRELDWAYSQTVYPKLARKYPNRWVAVAHHRVIASGTNLMKVHAAARRKVHCDEIPLVFVERGIHVYLIHGH